jgi:hypothetical protein
MAITHATSADDTFSSAGTTAWGEAHTVADGSITEAMLSIADNTTKNFSTAAHGFVPKGTNVGSYLKDDGTWAAVATGATLNGITAATGAVTIANGNNTGIVWNWANTTDSTICKTLGETTAATNGTSSSGVPNQALFKLITLAASTQSPLTVYSRGSHVFSVSPTTAQILAANGTSGAPAYSFASNAAMGMSVNSTNLQLSSGGTTITINNGGQIFSTSGTVTAPGLTTGNGQSGIVISNGTVIIALNTESARFNSATLQISKGSGDAVSYAINSRKSRGTVESPTVITTGDDLLTLSGFGYVGATNTYQEACRITFDSTGTISDSATGIGGVIRFLHAIVGAEPAEVAKFQAQHLIHEGTSPTITANGGTNPSIVGKDEAFEVTIGTGGTATSVEVTFGNAFTNAPICVAQSDTDIVPFKCVTTTTKVTISATLAFTAGSILHVVCRGWE